MMDAFVEVGMDGAIVETNDAFRRMLGFGPHEMNAVRYADLIPDGRRSAYIETVQRPVLERGYSDVLVWEYRRLDGSIFPVESRVFLVKDDAGNAMGTSAIMRDITNRVRLRQDLERERGLL